MNENPRYLPWTVRRAVFHWWRPACDGDTWAAIDEAWRALADALNAAWEMTYENRT